ncbi:MAG: hypothetical protein Q9182_006614 [Xanthomendoza sp. 2 TL-2023]
MGNEYFAFVVGVLIHGGFFVNGEHHMHGTRYLGAFGIAFLTVVAVLLAGDNSLRGTLEITTKLATYYLGGLYGSLLAYRVYLSPLRTFPGPISTKISSLCFSLRVRHGNSHAKLLELHQKYGDFVRVGSSDLSIIHPQAIDALYGRGSACTKASWYDLSSPRVGLQTTRDRQVHDKRRRIWGPAFSDAAVRGYEARIKKYQDRLVANIAERRDIPIDARELFELYNFDVMGDLAFGESFDMLQNTKQHWAIQLLHRGLEPLGLMFPMWCFRLLLAIPGATGDWFAFQDFCCQKLDKRIRVSSFAKS